MRMKNLETFLKKKKTKSVNMLTEQYRDLSKKLQLFVKVQQIIFV